MTPDQLADRLNRAADALEPAIRRKVEHAGSLGRRMIQNNASGRPGPNIQNSETPNYRDSWKSPTRNIPYGAVCTIGTDKPQGMRLEFGYYDMTDSLGRHYFQPPFPHVGPAIPAIGAALRQGMGEAVEEVFR